MSKRNQRCLLFRSPIYRCVYACLNQVILASNPSLPSFRVRRRSSAVEEGTLESPRDNSEGPDSAVDESLSVDGEAGESNDGEAGERNVEASRTISTVAGSEGGGEGLVEGADMDMFGMDVVGYLGQVRVWCRPCPSQCCVSFELYRPTDRS
jgi:hypothetical protein